MSAAHLPGQEPQGTGREASGREASGHGASGEGGAAIACEQMATRLGALERACGDATSADEAARLRAHCASCAPCALRHGGRLRTLQGVCALRSRAVPAGMLDDLRTRVLAQVRAGASGGMSPAFLDAPASLARWRRVAVAASLLLATGAGLMATGHLGLRPSPGAGDRDLRDALLPRLVSRPGVEVDDDVLQPVLLPGRGVRGFYVGLPGARDRDARALPARPAEAPESGD